MNTGSTKLTPNLPLKHAENYRCGDFMVKTERISTKVNVAIVAMLVYLGGFVASLLTLGLTSWVTVLILSFAAGQLGNLLLSAIVLGKADAGTAPKHPSDIPAAFQKYRSAR